MSYKRDNNLKKILKKERIGQQCLLMEINSVLKELNDSDVMKDKPKFSLMHQSNISLMTSGIRWRIEEFSAMRILMGINNLRNRKEEYTITEVFERERLLFMPK